MIDGLFGDSQFGGSAQRFACARVTNEAGMSAAGDLEANALARAEVVGSGPDVDLEVQAAIFPGGYAVGCEANDAVTQVDGFSGRVYGTETGEEVGVLQTGAYVEIGFDGADDYFVVIEDGTCINKDIGASLQFAIVFCSHAFSGAEGVSTNGWGWIGGIIAIMVRFRCNWWGSC